TGTELLDQAEEVVPPPGVQADDMVAELIQDLVHLKGREHGLDQDCRLDAPGRQAELLLGEVEDVVPEPGLAVVLELREVEVRAGVSLEQPHAVVEDVEAEVEQASRHRDWESTR